MKRWAIFVVAVIMATLLAPAAGRAGTSVGSFEIDGNKADSGPGEPLDWDSPGLPGLVTFTDGTGNTDDTFAGSKENVPNEWRLVNSPAPGKTDIREGAIATREIGGERFVYVNFTRAANTGDTFANFELNASRSTYVNSEGYEVPVRTAGDKLVAFFVTNGGKVLNIEVRSWVGDYLSGIWMLVGNGTQGVDWDAAVDADSNGRWTFAEAAVNFTALGFQPSCPGVGRAWIKTTTSAAFESASLADRTAQKDLNLSNCATKNFSFSFSPAPIAGTKVFATYTTSANETKTIELIGPDASGDYTGSDDRVPPGSFSSSFQVRADVDGDGVFTDVIWTSPVQQETFAPKEIKTNVGSLPYAIALSPAQAENFAGRPHLLTATVTHAVTGEPLPHVPVSFGIVSATPAGCGTLSVSSARTDASGRATTTLTSPAGCTASVRAWINGVGGTSGYDAGEANATAGKTFVVYALAVAPPSALNAPGTEHTFTVTLTRDTGSGPDGYAGQSIALTLDPGTSDAHFVRINEADASGTSATCTTTANGTCAVTITSSTAGTSTLNASYTTLNDSGEGTVTSSGTKTYVDYRVVATPLSAENEVGDEHTVVVTVERDQGDGFAPVEGIDVALTLNAGDTDAHLVSINGAAAEGTTGSCTTDAAGSCTVVFVATQPGTVSLTASIGVELDSGTLERDATVTKLFSDFLLTITPGDATNEIGDPHSFLVTLTRDDGEGFTAYAGEPVSLTLDPGATDGTLVSINGEPAEGLTGTCTTDEAGTCTIVAVSTTVGVMTLSAAWNGVFDGTSTASRDAGATKRYVSASLTSASCPQTQIAPGGHVDYSFVVEVAGGDLGNATLTDQLPASFRFESASPTPDVAPAPGESGIVQWDLGTIAEGTWTFTISGSIDPATPDGTVEQNVAVFDADIVAAKVSTLELLISTVGAIADGRAVGIESTGLLSIPAAPDSDAGSPAELIGLHDAAPLLDATLLRVAETGGVGAQASHTSVAAAADVSLDIGGVTVAAEGIVARATSSASALASGSTGAGSRIARLVVGTDEYLDVREPVTIPVRDGAGTTLAEIHVLEATATGAAGGEPQPAGGLYASGLRITGLRIVLNDLALTPIDESTEIVVAMAESTASYPQGLPCGAEAPSVSGDASLVDATLAPDLIGSRAGLITLARTGGDQNRTVADVTPAGVFAGTTATDGTLDPLQSSSSATVLAADLLGGTITATGVHAASSTADGTSSGSTTIASLVVGGTDVCEALGLQGTCAPDPDTVLLLDGGNVIVLLNEQIGGDGLRVNAVHIFVVGDGNPLGLPAGADIVIASAYSNTSA